MASNSPLVWLHTMIVGGATCIKCEVYFFCGRFRTTDLLSVLMETAGIQLQLIPRKSIEEKTIGCRYSRTEIWLRRTKCSRLTGPIERIYQIWDAVRDTQCDCYYL